MSREVRRVPAGWEHPKGENGRYIPLWGRSYRADVWDWWKWRIIWALGFKPNYGKGFPVKWRELDEDWQQCTFEEYWGPGPRREDYMPDWPASERTHWQMYEATSEGTPISPVMDSPEILARWLADNNTSAFGYSTATYDAWLATIQRGWAISAVFDPRYGVMSGVEAMAQDGGDQR